MPKGKRKPMNTRRAHKPKSVYLGDIQQFGGTSNSFINSLPHCRLTIKKVSPADSPTIDTSAQRQVFELNFELRQINVGKAQNFRLWHG